jgi:hypothetical protein
MVRAKTKINPKTAKTKTAAKQAADKPKPGELKNASKLKPDATVTWSGKPNPFREGCGAWKRTELVRKASGRSVAEMRSSKGLRVTTLATLARLELIKVG